MSMKDNIHDREFDSFVETSTGKTARRVVIADSSSGGSGSNDKTGNAGEVISAIKVIYSNGVSLFIADANTTYPQASAIGVTITAAAQNSDIRYITADLLYDSSFSFIDGEPVFLNTSGQLTQTDPATLGLKYRVLIGTASGPNSININIQEAIEL